MKRLLLTLPLLIFALIGAVSLVMLNLTSSGKRDAASIGFSMTGKTMPEVTMPRHDEGGTLSLGDMTGQVYAVNVFASWCAPCRLEASSIDEMARDILVIGINYRDDSADANAFLDQFGNPYHAIGRDGDGSISIQLGVHGLPETFIIGRDGVIAYHHQGPVLAGELNGPIAEAIRTARADP